MKALVYTSPEGYSLYSIQSSDSTGYYLYNNQGGGWFAYKNRVIEVENNSTISELKIKNPEYFL